MNEKVTIIMPVYNGKHFLESSVRSVFSQEYPDIELIVIDDGSTDDSYAAMSGLAEHSPSNVHMRVIRQENHGICYTRNKGLDLAAGEYILFMDQDDSIKKNYVEKLVSEIRKSGADILIAGYELINEEHKVIKKVQLDPDRPWSKYRISAPWGRIFRRNIIEENHIRFMITRISEDFYFNMVYLSYCKKIAVSRYTGYGWTYRKQSESHANMSVASDDRDVLSVLSKTLKDMHQPNVLEKECIEYMITKHVIWYLFFTAKSMDIRSLKNNYERCFIWLKRHFPEYRNNVLYSLKSSGGEAFSVRFIVWSSVLLEKFRLLYPGLLIYSKSGNRK